MYGNIFYDRGGECVKWREEHLILATKDTMVVVVVVSDIHNFFIILLVSVQYCTPVVVTTSSATVLRHYIFKIVCDSFILCHGNILFLLTLGLN